MSTKRPSLLNTIFIIHLVLFGLVITGVLSRDIVTILTIWLVFYFIWAPLEDSGAYFVRSIPFFMAIPLTPSFDQFNMWRILSAVIFLKWFFVGGLADMWPGFINFFKKPIRFLTKHEFIFLSGLLLFMATLSLTQTQDLTSGIKRVIYFINLSLVGIVLYSLILKNKDYSQRIIKNLAIPTIIVTVLGFVQLSMTYLMDIYGFMRVWGEGIECKLFGEEWCYIASWVGNTWFAYFGEQLSLRVFSIFPDSHSFPLFILFGLPSIFAIALTRATSKTGHSTKALFKTRAKWFVLWVPVILLAIILSGTRGMWLAGISTLIGSFIFATIFLRNHMHEKNVFKYLSSYILIFVLLFMVAYPIFASPQFLLNKDNSDLLSNRVRSIIDFGETSNSLRLEIWQKTFESIKKRPWLGVGIGNFPVVLEQDVTLARAGSSAHNLYLNIFAEMGMIAFMASLLFLFLMLVKMYNNYIKESDWFIKTYFASTLLFVMWGLLYLMTDIVLFDERAFLIFSSIVALTLGINNSNSAGKNWFSKFFNI
ncbi:MAG: hypothetical protein COV29_01590 [Candidatus Yanofskybacteria bacterium CG10_big_fil_rev_8_21_14_0_10_36_16]|uniref:O-antigen ligase-related domain-containing protein n=1 Tax=Candidatus Yanofskybacteria bacterium CG10_big_fil_rev_8_21_14_0_10_36_16 TaxID=1975096 RepID=A0A2J0Q7A3_9BACT|nr:MAG: hypothetical protein COV29_01590 [Candidatus Yanofskybacteria bacterium CG10_big_fil_rev_8_21_14_0_10_36_16]